jgi:hypothetical protein
MPLPAIWFNLLPHSFCVGAIKIPVLTPKTDCRKLRFLLFFENPVQEYSSIGKLPGCRSQMILSISRSVLGVLYGLCFVGVAFSLADKFLPVHRQFVISAFRLFTLAVLPYVVPIFCHAKYLRRYGWALAGFLGLLIGYLLLIQFGPSPLKKP